jgi:hypothetical protein
MAVSSTVAAASFAENGRASIRSGGANSPGPGTISGSPRPPGPASSRTLLRVRGPGGSTPRGGISSTMPPTSSSGSASRASTSR